MYRHQVLFLSIIISVASMPQDIFFPDDIDITSRTYKNPEACNFEEYEMYWDVTRRCEKLLESKACGAGKWLVWSNNLEKPVCSAIPCPMDKVKFEGSCISESIIKCPQGMHAILDITGEASCDCIPGHVYWDTTNSCYPAYSKGPCKTNKIIMVNEEGEAECLHNPCDVGKVQVKGTCFALGQQGHCQEGVLVVDPSNFRILCNGEWVDHFNLIGAPESPCPRGSRRDMQGVCRRIFRNRYQG